MDERTVQSGKSAKGDTSLSSVVLPWRTPAVILVCGCLIAMIGFGARSGLGFFLTPMSSAHGWSRDVFALALAIQMLLWGAAQPFAGAMADRFGAAPVLSVGAVLYALGLAAMAYAGTPAMLHLSAGVIIGFGLAGSSFTVVIGAFGKLMPPEWRSLAFGAGTAAGSFGQFVFSPLAVALIDSLGWQDTLLVFAAVVLLIMLPPSTLATLVFGAVIGLFWLSTVPPTSGLVALMFGTRWLAMLFGFAFFSHQVGGFLGVWLGGLVFERTGSYDAVWWLSILLGLLSAAINLPIVERPVARLAPATT